MRIESNYYHRGKSNDYDNHGTHIRIVGKWNIILRHNFHLVPIIHDQSPTWYAYVAFFQSKNSCCSLSTTRTRSWNAIGNLLKRFIHLCYLIAIKINDYYFHTVSNSQCVMLALKFLPLQACPQLETMFQFLGWKTNKMVKRSNTMRYLDVTNSK
jgi:hypothetical protein